MSLPYYKRYTRDLIGGTIGMGFELKLTYCFLIDLIMHHDGRLKDTPQYIAGQLECSVRKWNKLRLELIKIEKIYVENGFILNFRATLEAESLSKYRDKQSQNSKISKGNNSLSLSSLSHTDADTDADTYNPPNPPKGGMDFEIFKKAWPFEGDNKSKAEPHWFDVDQDAVISSLSSYSKAVKDGATRHGPRTYLRDKIYEDYAKGKSTVIVVTKDSNTHPQWQAWTDYRIATGVKFNRDTLTVETEWPPTRQVL